MTLRIAFLLLCVAAVSGGCGVESASTAATAAAVRQKEIEAGQKAKAQVEQQVGQALEQMQRNAQESADGEKR